MKKFNKRDGRDSRGSDRDYGRFGRRGFKEKFRVICDTCGKSCEVPFKPTGSKPVQCSDCFRKGGGARSADRSAELEKINAKLDRILELLGK